MCFGMLDDGFRLRVLACNVTSEDGKFILAVSILDVEDPWYMAGLDEIEGCGWNGRGQYSERVLLDEAAECGD